MSFKKKSIFFPFTSTRPLPSDGGRGEVLFSFLFTAPRIKTASSSLTSLNNNKKRIVRFAGYLRGRGRGPLAALPTKKIKRAEHFPSLSRWVSSFPAFEHPWPSPSTSSSFEREISEIGLLQRSNFGPEMSKSLCCLAPRPLFPLPPTSGPEKNQCSFKRDSCFRYVRFFFLQTNLRFIYWTRRGRGRARRMTVSKKKKKQRLESLFFFRFPLFVLLAPSEEKNTPFPFPSSSSTRIHRSR